MSLTEIRTRFFEKAVQMSSRLSIFAYSALVFCLTLNSTVFGEDQPEVEQAIKTLEKVIEKAYTNPGSSTVNSGPVITGLTDNDLKALLGRMGHQKIREVNHDTKATYFAVNAGGRNLLVINYYKAGDMQLHLVLTRQSGITEKKLKTVNDWNRRKRFAKSYLDNDGDFVLEADMDLQQGVTERAIQGFFKLYLQIANDFEKYVDAQTN